MSTRRQFLGQVLGTVVAIPFIAQAADLTTLLPEDKDPLQNFKFALRLTDGSTIWAPGVETILYDQERNALAINAKQLDVTETFTTTEMIVLGPDGQMLTNKNCKVSVEEGDSFKLTFYLYFSGEALVARNIDPLDYHTWREVWTEHVDLANKEEKEREAKKIWMINPHTKIKAIFKNS